MQLTVEGTDEGTARERRSDHHLARAADDREPQREGRRRRIDVTDIHAAGIEEFVRTNVETDAVSLEHRGGRTYLLLED